MTDDLHSYTGPLCEAGFLARADGGESGGAEGGGGGGSVNVDEVVLALKQKWELVSVAEDILGIPFSVSWASREQDWAETPTTISRFTILSVTYLGRPMVERIYSLSLGPISYRRDFFLQISEIFFLAFCVHLPYLFPTLFSRNV